MDSLIVLYASQTGNAEWIASHIQHEAVCRGFSSKCLVLDSYEEIDIASSSLLVFIASTTGDGDPPDNATKFWRWFRRGKPHELAKFKEKKYALLGLGDTNYSNFCNTAKRLDRKLVELGAVPIIPKGLADDATGLEAVVDSWIDALFKELPRHVAYDSGKLKEYEAKVAAGEIDSSMSAVAGLVSKKEQLVDDKADDGDEKKKKGKEEGEAKMMNLSSAVNDEKDFGIVSSSQTSSTTKTTSNPPPTASSCSPKLEDKVASMSITLSSLTTTATSEPFQQYTPRPLSLPTDVFESITQIKGQVKRAVEFVSISYPNDNDNITRSVESSRLASIYPLLRSQSSQTTSPPALLGPLNPALAIITRCRCLTGSKAEKRVIEIELDTTTTNSLLEEWMENTAAPGDAFALVCPNPDSMVLPLLDRLGFDPERVFEVEVQDGGDAPINPKTHKPLTHYEAFKYFLDISSFPRKPFFRMLSEHATSEVDKKWLLILSSTSGSSAFNTLRSSLTCLLDLLVTFPSVIPPLARLVEHLPKLQPRYYSIASFSTPPPPPIVSSISSHHSAKRLLTFAFNVVEMLEEEGGEDAVNGRRRRVFRRGLATGWLDELVGGVTNREWTSVGVGGGGGHAITIPIFPKPASEFRFTKIHALTTTPSHSDQQSQPHKQQHLVMIAAGTGIAPFMGFLQHIKSSSSSSTSGSGFKQVWLIYGGRYEGIDGDVCYEEELLQYKREGVLTRLDICLSRQGGAERRHQERQGVVEEATATLSSSLSTDFSLTPRNKDGAFYWDGTYVQDVVWRTGDDVWKLVQEDKGHVFVCGSMAMAKDLHQTLIKLADSKRQPILAKENNNVVGSDTSIQNTESSSSNTSYGGEELTTTATGLEYWTFKSKQGRYVREIWG